MKQVCFFIIALLASAVSLHAQTEAKGDSIRSHSLPEGTPPEGTFLPETKNYDGFLLDMSLMRMEAPRLPRFTLEIPDASKDYSRIRSMRRRSWVAAVTSSARPTCTRSSVVTRSMI